MSVETAADTFTVTYGKDNKTLTDAEKTVLADYNADAILTLDRALEENESVELTLEEGTITVTNADVDGKEVKLSTLLEKKGVTTNAKASEQKGNQ